MEQLILKDPQGTRVVKSLPLPPQKPLPAQLIFKNNHAQWRTVRSFLKHQGKINRTDFHLILKTVMSIFRAEPNLIQIQDPITIVGDIHGQYYDLLKLLDDDVGGDPKNVKYLFLGDYVDRGIFSVQVITLLFTLKIAHPQSVILLRGNHQSRQITSHFNFKSQCIKKYDQQTYDYIMDIFDLLPLACLLNGKFLCVHGGISPQMGSLNDIMRINRVQEVPTKGLMCDLLWADPVKTQNGVLGALVVPNQPRGCSYFFGRQLTNQFFANNRLLAVIRAHQVQQQGFKVQNWAGTNQFPSVITIFSAPNYCDYYKNKGAVIRFANNNLNLQQYTENVRPYFLPNHMDAFTWSVPFLSTKITEMLLHIIKPNQLFNYVQLPYQYTEKARRLQQILLKHQGYQQRNLQLAGLNGNLPDDKLLETGRYSQTYSSDFSSKINVDWQNQSRPKSYY